MRFGADIQQGPYRPPSNFDYPQREIGDNQRRFYPNLFDEYGGGGQKTIRQNFQHYRIECLNYVIDWQLQHYRDVVKRKVVLQNG